MDAGRIVIGLLDLIVEAAPGFLAAITGKASDDEALEHAHEAAERFKLITPGMRARSAAARAAKPT